MNDDIHIAIGSGKKAHTLIECDANGLKQSIIEAVAIAMNEKSEWIVIESWTLIRNCQTPEEQEYVLANVQTEAPDLYPEGHPARSRHRVVELYTLSNGSTESRIDGKYLCANCSPKMEFLKLLHAEIVKRYNGIA